MWQTSGLEKGRSAAHIQGMEKLICQTCKSEYEVHDVDTRGWGREPADELCEICGAVLKRFEPDRKPILVLTKRGDGSEAA